MSSTAATPSVASSSSCGRLECSESMPRVLQPHFVVICLSALVVGLLGAVLVASPPVGPGPGHDAVERGGDQVCQETLDLAQRDWDEAAARACGAIAEVTAR